MYVATAISAGVSAYYLDPEAHELTGSQYASVHAPRQIQAKLTYGAVDESERALICYIYRGSEQVYVLVYRSLPIHYTAAFNLTKSFLV